MKGNHFTSVSLVSSLSTGGKPPEIQILSEQTGIQFNRDSVFISLQEKYEWI